MIELLLEYVFLSEAKAKIIINTSQSKACQLKVVSIC